MTLLDTFQLRVIPNEAEALREPLRALLSTHVAQLPADRRARSWMGFDAGLSRALGRAGFLGLTTDFVRSLLPA